MSVSSILLVDHLISKSRIAIPSLFVVRDACTYTFVNNYFEDYTSYGTLTVGLILLFLPEDLEREFVLGFRFSYYKQYIASRNNIYLIYITQ